LKRLIGISLIMLLAFVGCGSKEVVKPSEEAAQSKRALETLGKMREAYVARDMPGVLVSVSPDLKEGYSEFQTSLRRDIEGFPKVELNIDIDRVEISDKLTKPVFHWTGKWTDKSGVTREGRGNAIIGFKESGQAMVVDTMTGDSPFGVVK